MRRARWPTWVIATGGTAATIIGVIWAGSLYDDHGNPLIDNPVASVLVAIIGAGGTLAAVGLRRMHEQLGNVAHQVHNNSGSSMKDGVDRTEQRVARIEKTQEAIGRSLARLESVPDDVRGLRKDIGRLADADAHLRADLSDHIRWAREQEDRIDDLEDTVDPRRDRKKE